MDVALKLLGFLLTIGIVVTWHELGHYWAAKWAGVKVLRFSVGFGTVIKKWVRGADKEEWALSAIPMGGYVKMLDEREGDVAPHERGRSFNAASLAKRSIIVAAGPFANFVLAVALLAALNMSGVSETRALIDVSDPASPAAKAGLASGDEITAVNGATVVTWNEARWRLLLSAGSVAQVTTTDGRGQSRSVDVAVPAPAGDDAQDPVSDAGFSLYNPMPAVVGEVTFDGVARKAGLRVGDRVTRVDGERVERWADFSKRIAQSPNRAVVIEVQRGDGRETLQLIPAAQRRDGKTVGLIGVRAKVVQALLESTHRVIHYGPIDAVVKAAERTWDLSIFTLRMFGKIITGQASLKNISGPVTMADYAGQSIQTGLSSFIAFLALISISIGVLNLLPIPMLDGGHLLYHAIEAVRGTPPSLRMMEWGQRIGVGFVVLLMSLAFFNDLTRYFIGR